jgi:hypothetical protein
MIKKGVKLKQFCPEGHDTFIVGRDKHHGGCRSCTRRRIKQWNNNNLDKLKEMWRKACWKQKGIHITKEHYDKLFLKQNKCCAICNTLAKGLKRRLDVDHNHKTGKVRGLLCAGCNIGLGRFKDNSSLLKKAAVYLNAHR